MTKTTNYQLNQWDATDRVLRTDFNSDNQKIDAALKAAADAVAVLESPDRFVKLKEVTVTADTEKDIVIDLSGVDWSQWNMVHLDLINTNGQQMWLYYNSTANNQNFYPLSGSQNHGMYHPRLTFRVGYTPNREVRAEPTDRFAGTPFPYSQLKKIIASGAEMDAGAQFVVWGER